MASLFMTCKLEWKLETLLCREPYASQLWTTEQMIASNCLSLGTCQVLPPPRPSTTVCSKDFSISCPRLQSWVNLLKFTFRYAWTKIKVLLTTDMHWLLIVKNNLHLWRTELELRIRLPANFDEYLRHIVADLGFFLPYALISLVWMVFVFSMTQQQLAFLKEFLPVQQNATKAQSLQILPPIWPSSVL